MKLDIEKILARADDMYAEAKCGDSVYYMAPELRPRIKSEQVRSAVRAIVEALNDERSVQ